MAAESAKRGVRLRFAFSVGASLSLACGGSGGPPSIDAAAGDVAVESSSAEASVDSAVVDANADAGIDDATPPTLGCPASPPQVGAPCRPPGSCPLDCEYGDDPRPTFNLIMSCEGTSWVVSQKAAPSAEGGAPIDAGCPPSYAEAQTSQASCDPSLTCSYPEGICTCDTFFSAGEAGTALGCSPSSLPPSCPGTLAEAIAATSCTGSACFYPGGRCLCATTDAGPLWDCVLPAPGCPSERPRIGSPCDADASGPALCSYNIECDAINSGQLDCCGGLWQGLPGPLCVR